MKHKSLTKTAIAAGILMAASGNAQADAFAYALIDIQSFVISSSPFVPLADFTAFNVQGSTSASMKDNVAPEPPVSSGGDTVVPTPGPINPLVANDADNSLRVRVLKMTSASSELSALGASMPTPMQISPRRSSKQHQGGGFRPRGMLPRVLR